MDTGLMKTRRFKLTETPPTPLGIKRLEVLELKADGRFCAPRTFPSSGAVALGLVLLAGSMTARANVAQADSADFTLNTTGLSPGSGGVAQGDSLDFTLNTTGVTPGVGGAAQGDSADFTLDTTGVLPGTGGGAQADSADFTLDTRSLRVLISFAAGDGRISYAGLIEASDGALYGTTSAGGSVDAGTVFKLNKDGRDYTVLHSFSSANLDGFRPHAEVVEGSDGALYGTTRLGGNDKGGTVFRLSKDGSGYTLLHHFSLTAGDGHAPHGALVEGADGALYGTTFGTYNLHAGTVFKLRKDGSGYSVVHRFRDTGDDGGRGPGPELIKGSDGALYGTTYYGSLPYSINNVGSVFKLNEDGSGFGVLHNFRETGDDGVRPLDRLMEGSDGALYGTTPEGGTAEAGTAFRLNKDGSGYVVLRSFGSVRDGSYPNGALVEGVDGALYGVTDLDGYTGGTGVVFRMGKDGSAYTVLHHFSGSDGKNPVGALVKGSDGAFYGTTSRGGEFDRGVVFRLAAAPLVQPRPTLIAITLSGPKLVLSGSNGLSGATYYVMMSPNAALPLNQWTPVGTNVLGASGPFTITVSNAVDPGVAQRFYLLKQQ